MYDHIYYCRNEGNTCDKKDTCLRYLNAVDHPVAALFKASCTLNNEYLLYINKDKIIKKGDENES